MGQEPYRNYSQRKKEYIGAQVYDYWQKFGPTYREMMEVFNLSRTTLSNIITLRLEEEITSIEELATSKQGYPLHKDTRNSMMLYLVGLLTRVKDGAAGSIETEAQRVLIWLKNN